MDLVISDNEPECEEEAISIHRKRGLKSDKLRTVDTSVLPKEVWPHEVVYTSIGKLVKLISSAFPSSSVGPDSHVS